LARKAEYLTWDVKTSLIADNFPTRQEGAVNKSQLVEAVADTAGLEKRQAEAAVGAFVDSVVASTRSGEPVSIFGFGTFKPTARAARKGRNPQTGAAVKIAASKGVKFQPATAFKTVLNTRGGAKKAAAAKKTTVAKKATPVRSTAATKTATRSTAATRATAAKAPAAKAPAAKAPAKKAPAKKAPAKKAATPAKKVAKTASVAKATAKKAVKSVKKR
jgi:DNA-binding protein HU-beta